MNLFVTGTDTGVGKTFITAGIAASMLNEGATVGVYKPVQTGASRDKNKNFIADDIEFIKNIAPNVKTKCSYILEIPAAPSVAADIVDVTIEKDVIKKDFEELKKSCDITIVEGAGGLMTPFGKDFLAADIAKMLNLPIVIVARADLGTINHTLLTVEYAKKKGLKIAGIIINNYPEGTNDVAIRTAPMIIQRFAQADFLDIVPKNQNPFGTGILELVSKHVNILGLLSAK
jgi:dethiobiotin synthetase